MRTLPVIVVGAGGHAKVLIDILHMNHIPMIGLTDKNMKSQGKTILGVPIIGDDDLILSYSPQKIMLVNGLGSTGSTLHRQQIFTTFKDRGYGFCNVIHKSAILAKDISYGEGIQVMAGSVIQPGCVLGNNVILNTKASVDHDCVVGDHVHIAPGTTICGGVIVGEGAHVGTGSVVVQGVKIGKASIVGAGAVVTKDIPDYTLVMGVPAKAVHRIDS
jgi:sugar O-acyltransferase (sialic acid O-acetyltransferase NeuD family)